MSYCDECGHEPGDLSDVTDEYLKGEMAARGFDEPWLRWYEMLAAGRTGDVLAELRERMQDETGRVLP